MYRLQAPVLPMNAEFRRGVAGEMVISRAYSQLLK